VRRDVLRSETANHCKVIYDQVCAMGRLPQPAEEDLHDCMKAIHQILTLRRREYYFFGGISCKLLAGVQRRTSDVDIVIENCSMALPNPRDWLATEPFFWSVQQEQYVFVAIRDNCVDGSHPDILCQGRCFVEIDVNIAGWGSFPLFHKIKNALVPLTNFGAMSLPRGELLKLKMAGWGEKSRREGPKRANDVVDIVHLRTRMFLEGETMDTEHTNATTREGIKEWIREFRDMADWEAIRYYQ